jgi:hypothetical protein
VPFPGHFVFLPWKISSEITFLHYFPAKIFTRNWLCHFISLQMPENPLKDNRISTIIKFLQEIFEIFLKNIRGWGYTYLFKFFQSLDV